MNIFRHSLSILTLACCVAATSAEAADRPAVEAVTRGGLPNFFSKAEAGATLNVAYFGGSITDAAGWRVQTLDRFKKQYPQSQFKEIHGAISGTNSALGAFRLQQDVLQYNPDLLFIEFAVNDGGTPAVQLHRSMEGIVRQAWKHNPNMDICFIYTLTEYQSRRYLKGLHSESAAAMEDVADFYAIPSIALGVDIAQQMAAQKLIFTSKLTPEQRAEELKKGICHFSGDGCHPFGETGHVRYTDTIMRSFAQFRKDVAPAAIAHSLAKTMRTDNLENAKMISLSKAKLSAQWKKLDAKTNETARSYAKRMPELWLGTPGATVDFTFKGSEIRIYDLAVPDGCVIAYSIDGGPVKREDRISKGIWSHCGILSTVNVGVNLSAGVHTVHMEVAPEPIQDKLKYLNMSPKYKTMTAEELAASPVSQQNWYVANILLDGDLQ